MTLERTRQLHEEGPPSPDNPVPDYKRVATLVSTAMADDQREGGYGLVKIVLPKSDEHAAQVFRSGVRCRVVLDHKVPTESLFTRVRQEADDPSTFNIWFSLTSFREIETNLELREAFFQ